MKIYKQFYINGKWVNPVKKNDSFDVLNPANEKVIGQVSLGTPHDIDSAVISARNAFNFFRSFGLSSNDELIGILNYN